MNKTFKLFSIMLLVLALAVTTIQATSANYEIKQIDVDGITVIPGTSKVEVERGETVSVEVWLLGLTGADVDDAKVKAWIGGYEYDDIEDITTMFSIEDGITYRKVLTLEIPEDIDADDSYTLHVEVFDGDDSYDEEFDVKVTEKRHFLNLVDVIFTPGLNVEAGKTVFSSVRVENLGAKKEDDIKVTMSVPELGLSTRTYIDELVALEDYDDEETSASSEQLFVRIPENVKSGQYELIIEVSYNRGHDAFKRSYVLNVDGREVSPGQEAEAVISIDTTSQNIAQGEGAVYKLSFANLGSQAQVYSLEVSGTSTWATARVDPASITVMPNGASEMFVFVSANEEADLGTHFLTVTIKAGDEVVKQLNLKAEVTGNDDSDNFYNVRKGLEVGFLVLLVILVILGLVLAGKKLGNSGKEEFGEPGSNDKSYY